MFPRAICFSKNECSSLSPPKMQCFCDFWVLRCRFDLIDREKYRNPRSMNFQRATNLDGEDIIFALFSQSLSLSRRFIQQQQVQKLLAEKGGSIGIDAFCPVMNYEGEERERKARRRYREMRRSVAA